MLYYFGRHYREQIFRQLWRDHRQRIDDAAELAQLEQLTDALFHAYRCAARSQQPSNRLAWIDQRIDEAIYTDQPERMDLRQPTLARHLQNIESLDRLNRSIGTYHRFAGYLARWSQRFSQREPLSVLDLASGHGAFPLHLAEAAGRHGWPLQITGSDIDPDYVRLATQRATETGAPVQFIEINALEMSAQADDAVDIITCTQSIHHFTPGQLARMMRESSRVARLGLMFIDAKRGLAAAVAVALVNAAVTRNPDTIHDGWISLRKMYLPEELRFIARLAGVPNVTVQLHLPGFVTLTAGAAAL